MSKKGYVTEELVRAYFLRAGLFVVRSIPVRFKGQDLTDVDVWLYEKSTGSSRRVQIVDVKSRTKPKAVERLFWTKGLMNLLGVDGAYIVTTDSRKLLKDISRRMGISILDGTDIKRMRESKKVVFADRLHEEDIVAAVASADKSRGSKDIQDAYNDLKASLIDSFASGAVNRALENFTLFSKILTSSHPNGSTAEISLRLSYLAASIVIISLDSALTNVSFKSIEEKRISIVNILRFGNEDENKGLEKIRIAARLVEEYAPNGAAMAQTVFGAAKREFEKIPAEGIAEYVLLKSRPNLLFELARGFEKRGFNRVLSGFDDLEADEKSMLGVLLDFCIIDRKNFADSWCISKSGSLPLFEQNSDKSDN